MPINLVIHPQPYRSFPIIKNGPTHPGAMGMDHVWRLLCRRMGKSPSSRCSILQIRLDRERKDGDRLAAFLDTILKFVKDAGYGQSPEIVDALETYRRGARVIDEQDGLKEEPSE